MACRFALFFILLGLCPAFAAHYPIKLGDTTVTILREQRGIGHAFVHLHQNETTALKAIKVILREQGGSLLTLKHRGGRNIVFHIHHHRYEFDPNRMFTDVGIKKSLSQYGHYDKVAHKEVKKLARQIKKFLSKGKIVAVHNNRSYSLKNYLPGKSLSSDIEALHFNKKKQYRNFFLVTKKSDYLRLKQLNFNSIWQSHQVRDDGSLSVYLSNRDYVNVECGYRSLQEQINMLKHA